MSSPRGRASSRPPVPAAPPAPRRRWPAICIGAASLLLFAVIAAEHTSHGRSIVSSVQEFLLKYAGVFALIGLTAAVGVGVLATDRIVMRPGSRVVAQSVHRGVSLAALTALITHILLEIVAHRVGPVDAIIPFMSRFRTLYTGIGTLASDLFILIVITGAVRGRFAGKRAGAWRGIHASAYLCWLFAVVHGLLGGRTAKPYVDWSYGGCMALVALALAVRYVATQRTAEEKLAHPVPDRMSVPAEGLIPGTRVSMAPISGAHAARAALPAGQGTAGPVTGPLSAIRTGPMSVVRTGPLPTVTGPMPAVTGPMPTVTGPMPSVRTGPLPRISEPLPSMSAAPVDALGADDPRNLAAAGRRPARHAPPPAPRYSAAEIASARQSQAQQLKTQQQQAQARHERLMRQENPAPGWAPGSGSRDDTPGRAPARDDTPGHGPARDDATGWRADVDSTDPRGWSPDAYRGSRPAAGPPPISAPHPVSQPYPASGPHPVSGQHSVSGPYPVVSDPYPASGSHPVSGPYAAAGSRGRGEPYASPASRSGARPYADQDSYGDSGSYGGSGAYAGSGSYPGQGSYGTGGSYGNGSYGNGSYGNGSSGRGPYPDPGAYPGYGSAADAGSYPSGAPAGLGAWVSPGAPDDPGGVYAWPDARDLSDAHGWTDKPGQGGHRR